MTQKAADKYFSDLDKDNGLLIVDEDLVPNVPDFPHVIKVPITKMASEKLGKLLFANIVALGIMVKLSGIVSLDTVKQSVANRVPPHTVDKNMQALELGYNAV